MRRLIALFVIVTGLGPAALAYGATISGVVFISDHGTWDKVAGAQVTLSGPSLPGVRVATSDAYGRFHFGAVPAGREYKLEAQLTGTSPWPMTIEYTYSGDQLYVELPLDLGIRECSLGRVSWIPVTPPAALSYKAR